MAIDVPLIRPHHLRDGDLLPGAVREELLTGGERVGDEWFRGWGVQLLAGGDEPAADREVGLLRAVGGEDDAVGVLGCGFGVEGEGVGEAVEGAGGVDKLAQRGFCGCGRGGVAEQPEEDGAVGAVADAG